MSSNLVKKKTVIRNWSRRGMCVLALLAIGGLMAMPSFAEPGNGQRVMLPLADFIAAQGTYDVWYPPEPALFAWSGRPPNYPNLGWIDYVGAADRWLEANGYPTLGTTVTGTFSRQIIGPNLVEYTAIVHAQNALAWCVKGNDGVTLLFGAHVDQVALGATPALGRVDLHIAWRQNLNEPIADVNLAANYGDPYRPGNWKLIYADIFATADGPLHEAAGLGPESTPGKMVISQNNSNPQALDNSNGEAHSDAFPAEVMDLHAVGN